MTNELGIIIENNRPVVSSRKVAEVFEKEHYNVLRDIKALDCGTEFNALNFEAISYIDSMNREKPEYLMTRDGFTLLAMGFTGAKAMQWKIKYIAAFNDMEAKLANPFNIPKTLPEALRLAAELEEKRLILEAKIEEDKPYTTLGYALTSDQKETSVGQMATILSQSLGYKVSRDMLFAVLERDGYLCTTETEWHRPRQKWQDNGILKYRVHDTQTRKGIKRTFTPYFTPKGRAHITEKYTAKGIEN